MKKHNGKKKRRRVIALLTRDEMEFLERLGMDSLFSTGSKLSRVEVISALVDAAMLLNISAIGVKNKKELVQKMLDLTNSRPERRKYPRLKKNLIVHFRKIESMEKYESGTTVDIGVGGFRVDVAFIGKPLAANQPIEISVSEPQQKSEPIKAIGRVAWIKEKGDDHSYEIGVMLTYINEKERTRFLKYLGEEQESSPCKGTGKDGADMGARL